LNDPIEVTARFEPDGRITPLHFVARGAAYPVDSTGRQWQDETGLHILAMVPGERVVELIFAPGELRWYLRSIPGPRVG